MIFQKPLVLLGFRDLLARPIPSSEPRVAGSNPAGCICLIPRENHRLHLFSGSFLAVGVLVYGEVYR